jgi:hypothetical protein
MITADDFDFHPRDPSDRTWTETTFVPFGVPEAGIFGNAYVLARPNLGVAISSIIVSKGFCRQPYEIDFTDPQMHLPCPASFTKYSLENGLSVEVTKAPLEYRLTYENRLGACRFDLSFRGLHRPFDPNDPNENPLLKADREHEADARLGHEWSNGHFEVKGHITGELELRGRRYTVDYYDGMDHSWGPRSEVGTRAVSWISVNFGEELAMHLAVPMNLRNGEVTYDALRFGFVVERGEVFGIIDANVEATRVDMLPMSNRIRATDVRGRKYDFFGTAVGGHPWHSFNPCHVCYQVLMRYQDGNRVGYGEFGDIFGLDYLAERMSRTGRQR